MTMVTELTNEQYDLIDRLLDLAIDEDVGTGDATTLSLFSTAKYASGRFTARQSGVMACGEIVRRLFSRIGARINSDSSAVCVEILKNDGQVFHKGESLISVSGSAAIILMGERTALNLLQRLCAVATRTRKFSDLVAGTKAGVYDTRKTTPGMRILEKMAVKAGGGCNHRMGLYDMVLIKDNHIAAFGGVAEAVTVVRGKTSLKIMVEVDTIDQLQQVLPANPDYILLDNMDTNCLSQAVHITEKICSQCGYTRPLLEASGGITLDTIANIAHTGVDRISVGSLTNGVESMDIGLDFD